MKQKLGKDVATEILKDTLEGLGISFKEMQQTKDGEKTLTRLTNALMSGHLEYDSTDEAFKVSLLKPLTVGEKTIDVMTITEPTGLQLRSMSEVKKDGDDVGKAMAVLGDVTGLGLPVINKLKSRDLMLSVEVIGLFL